MNEEEILYKAKNSKNSMFFALICSLLMIGFAIFIQLFKLKYSSRPFISVSSTLDWVLIVLIITAICIIIASIYSYFTNFLGITKSGLLVKYGVIYQKVPFKDIELIKRYIAGRYAQGITGKAYTLIKMKNGTEVLASSITSLEDFTKKIKLYYPSFNNDKGIIESYKEDINVISIIIIMLLIAIYCIYKIHSGTYNTSSLIECLSIPILVTLFYIVKLIGVVKNRYFSEDTKMMLASIKASEKELEAKEEERLRQLKEQEEESIVTNYCPICRSRLIDFKCNRCEVSLDNIYDVKKFYCINCGTKREDLEPACLNCGFSFNL